MGYKDPGERGRSGNKCKGKRMGLKLFAIRPASTSLYFHVLHVLELSTKKKMVGVHARRVITAMKNVQTVWHFAVRKFVRDYVRPHFDVLTFAPHLHGSIATSTIACPEPAAHGFLNLYPKPSRDVVECVLRPTGLPAELIATRGITASLADAWYLCVSHDLNLQHRLGFVVRLVRRFAPSFEPFAF